MRFRVREQDLLLDVLAQRRLGALQTVEEVVRQHLVDGAHAVRPLGMPGAGVVLSKSRMREKECRHGCACRVLIVASGFGGRAMLMRPARQGPARLGLTRIMRADSYTARASARARADSHRTARTGSITSAQS